MHHRGTATTQVKSLDLSSPMAPTTKVRSPDSTQIQAPYRGPGRGAALSYSIHKGDDDRGDTFVVDENRDIQSIYDPKHQDLLECLRDMKCPKDYVDGEHEFVVAGIRETQEFFPQPCVPRYLDPKNCDFVL